MVKFYLPIGDWSADGHGMCEKFLVESNLPIERVREAHYRIFEATGVNIEGICDDFQKNTISDAVLKQLKALGFEPINYCGDPHILLVDDMLKLWIFLLEKADDELKLQVIEDCPMLPFYGSDEKGRHIGNIGYGLF